MSEVIEVKAEELAAIMEQSTVRAERILRLEDELDALKSAPVVIPENLKPFTTSADYGSGWNDALSEVLRMNRSNTNEQ